MDWSTHIWEWIGLDTVHGYRSTHHRGERTAWIGCHIQCFGIPIKVDILYCRTIILRADKVLSLFEGWWVYYVMISGSEVSDGGGGQGVHRGGGAERSLSMGNVCTLRSLKMVGSI